MSYLQSAYIFIAKPFGAINTEKNRKVRDVLVFLCFFAIFVLILVFISRPAMFKDEAGELSSLETALLGLNQFQNAIICGTILLIATLLSVENGIKKVPWNWFIGYIWLFLSVLIVISGLFHNIGSGSIVSQVIIALILPMLFLAWHSRDDSERLYVLVSYAIIALVFIVGFMSILAYPLADNTIANNSTRYMSFLNNPNRLGFFATTGAVAAVYLCGYMKKFWIIIPAAALGICLQFAWLCKARSSALAILLLLVLWMLLHLKNKDSVKKLLAFILIAAVVCGATAPFITREAPEKAAYNSVPIPLVAVAKAAEGDALERLQSGDDTGDYTSGRIAAWKEYVKYINITGNDASYYLPIKAIDEESGFSVYYSLAHNTPLEVAFRSGIPAGILFLLLELIALWYVIVRLLGRRKNLNRADLFACPAMLAFIIISTVESLVESLNGIFTTNVSVMFFLACGVLFTFGMKKEESDTEV